MSLPCNRAQRATIFVAPNVYALLLISITMICCHSGTAVLANCLNDCNCNEDILEVVCEESRLDVLPITLNPSTQRLIIRNNNIKTIDSSIQFYPELQHLDLSQNHLVHMPRKGFAYQRKLQELYLNHNEISSVTNDTFQGLNSLKVLNLRRNLLTELTNDVFATLRKLEELNLGQNKISKIEPRAFAGLSALRILYLDDNQLSSVPTNSFSPLENLAELHIGINLFFHLPDDTFACLNRLTLLDLKEVGLVKISNNAFRGLTELKILNLSHNRLNLVPTQELSGLIKLEELYLGQNDFSSLENHSFQGLKNLKLLNIIGAYQLERIAKGAFEDNINLETLILVNNKQLTVIEDTLLDLPKLKHVTIRENANKDLGDSVFIGKESRQLDFNDRLLKCTCQL